MPFSHKLPASISMRAETVEIGQRSRYNTDRFQAREFHDRLSSRRDANVSPG